MRCITRGNRPSLSGEMPSQHGITTVSEGGLEPVERPLDKRVSDILSAKMDPGGPGCTPLLRIGALQERTKVAPDNDPGTKSGPGMSDPHWSWGVELGYESVDPDCGAWIDKALRWRGPDNAKVRSSVFRPSSSAVFRAVRSIGDEVRAAGAMRG
jgi:hypothetical protein